MNPYQSIYEKSYSGKPVDIILTECEVDLERAIEKLEILAGLKESSEIEGVLLYEYYQLKESPQSEIKKVHNELVELLKNYRAVSKLVQGEGGIERLIQNKLYCHAKVVYSLYRLNKFNKNIASQDLRQVAGVMGIAFQDNRDLMSILQQLKRNFATQRNIIADVIVLEQDAAKLEAALNILYDIIESYK